ncbi:MAG: biosynthetic arginine decarboxylase [Gammaproteobacteria bacterium]
MPTRPRFVSSGNVDPGTPYGLARWGGGFFAVDAQGHLVVRPDRDPSAGIDLCALTQDLLKNGLRFPILIRFPEILKQRLAELTNAFALARRREKYEGTYLPIYPVKVNQEHAVVTSLVEGAVGGIGLEAGSKPELVMALALVPPGGTIIANGYKDRAYIRLALLAGQLGLRVFLVLEKPSELGLVLEEARRLECIPRLGVRVRLAAIASGKWQNTGGAKSKFGFTIPELLETLERLEDSGWLGNLELLHFHLGSQIANLRDIQGALQEAGRIWAELQGRGVPLRTVDVGGGLAVDYEGTRSRSDCSMNYSIEQYAEVIVRTFQEASLAAGCAAPDLMSESGRSLCAHHAVLVTDVIETESPHTVAGLKPRSDPDWALRELWALYEREEESATPEEVYQEALYWLQEVHARFSRGVLDLAMRAEAERLFQALIQRLESRWDPGRGGSLELRAELEERLAQKMFCNLSIFQSLPDIWALEQIFPIVPLAGLARPPARHVRLYDLTCDSDGRIDRYVGSECLTPTLPVPDAAPGALWLGFFLIGAYQEILGDMHNLFGATGSVVVERVDGRVRHSRAHPGDTALDLLAHVHWDEAEISSRLEEKLRQSHLADATRQAFRETVANVLSGSTYLLPEGG